MTTKHPPGPLMTLGPTLLGLVGMARDQEVEED
jgi:hypothetical protein